MAGPPRLFVDAAGLAAGQTVALTGGQTHYLAHVLRRRPGDPVRVFNGHDGEWLARLEGLSGRGGSARLDRRTRPQPPPAASPWLCFALVKRGPLDLIAGKATELGCTRLIPVTTRFTDMPRLSIGRLRVQAVEAAEQCGRLTVPAVDEPVGLAERLTDWPAERSLIVCAERGAAPPLTTVAAALAGRPAALLIGPEGGFSPEELDALRKLDFAHLCHLGPRVLRAETAAIAALACWQAVAGDWADGRTEPAADAPF